MSLESNLFSDFKVRSFGFFIDQVIHSINLHFPIRTDSFETKSLPDMSVESGFQSFCTWCEPFWKKISRNTRDNHKDESLNNGYARIACQIDIDSEYKTSNTHRESVESRGEHLDKEKENSGCEVDVEEIGHSEKIKRQL